MSRCQAFENGKQCRRSKNLTRTLITIHREEHFIAKLPEGAVVVLCPDHLRLSPLEHLLLRSLKPGQEHAKAESR
jgi:hypothetical protein